MGGFLQTLSRIGPARLLLIAVVGAGMIGFFTYLGNRFTQPEYALLYGDLDLKDSGEVATKLDTLGVQYQVRANGAIFVPVDQVGRMRLAMAEMGIPHGGSVGYEIFDKSDLLGATSFQQGINEMRAKEGELARTIQLLSAVESARVHLVLPKRELFSRDAQEPSATVVLQTRSAGALPKGQVAAILNLVATAVAGLKTNRISIIDQAGNLLARGTGGDAGDGGMGPGTAEEQRVALETKLSRNVEDMLERSLGFGRARVDVNADLDLDRLVTNQETYDPAAQVTVSTESTNEAEESTQAQDQSAVSVQTNLPNGAQTQQGPNNSTPNRSKTSKSDERTNYENSKKVISQTREAGSIKRLSVAVLVDGTYTTNEKGERSYQARSPEEIAAITKLVKSAIGYDEKRGDQIDVENMRFSVPEEAPAESSALFMGLEKSDLFRIGEMAVALIVALLLIFMVLRPLVKRSFRDAKAIAAGGQAQLTGPGQPMQGALPAPSGSAGTALVPSNSDADEEAANEAMIDIGRVEGRVRASSMRKIGEIVDKHPEEAVSIIRSWMYQSQ